MNENIEAVLLLAGLICFLIVVFSSDPYVEKRLYLPQIAWLALGLFLVWLPTFWNTADNAGWWSDDASAETEDGIYSGDWYHDDEPVEDGGYSVLGFKQDENPVVFHIYRDGMPATLTAPFLIQGIEEWGTVGADVDTIGIMQDGLPASHICSAYNGANVPYGYDGINSVVFAHLEGNTIGRACSNSGANECDIVLDNTWLPMLDNDIARTVLLHEAGHCMGIGHSEVLGAVMLPIFTGAQHLSLDDIAALHFIYGIYEPPPGFQYRQYLPNIAHD